MNRELKFRQILENLIGEINEAKRKSGVIHSAGNIKSSGDEVEKLIREKISLFLPERYMVKQGHVVNPEGKVSPQFDIIIFDRMNTPKFFESQNNTVFYPIESVMAVGEIKKTLMKGDLIEFGKKIRFLKKDMKRLLIENSVFGGNISKKTTISDLATMSTDRKYKNPLFSFIFGIDEKKINDIEIDDDYEFMPNDVYVLNYGFYIYGDIENNRVITKIEDEEPLMNTWLSVKEPGVICLAMMFKQIIDHLNKCHIEPFSISAYLSNNEDFGIRASDVKVYRMKKIQDE
jgi:hypothetical protein